MSGQTANRWTAKVTDALFVIAEPAVSPDVSIPANSGHKTRKSETEPLQQAREEGKRLVGRLTYCVHVFTGLLHTHPKKEKIY